MIVYPPVGEPKIEVKSHTCSYHKLPGNEYKDFAGCGCSTSYSISYKVPSKPKSKPK